MLPGSSEQTMSARLAKRLPGSAQLVGALRGVSRSIRVLWDGGRAPFALVRQRVDPKPPVAWNASWVAELSHPSADKRFFSTNSLAARCRYVFNYGWFTVNEECQNNWYYSKTDDVDYFLAHHAPDTDFVLFSGHTDSSIGRRYKRHLRRPELTAWFGVNVTLEDPKLVPMPLGIANPHPRWPNGDAETLRKVQESGIEKRRLFHAAYTVRTNPRERKRCLRETGVELDPPMEFEDYLVKLASSYFCISPKGRGIDCNRTWEALYMRAIPVVTRSALTDRHPDFPMIVVEDWSEFRSIDFSPDLYERTWGDWRLEAISLEGYLRRVQRTIADLSSR